MPVAVLGMHRSGTSLVAQMLARAGLHLGGADDLYAAAADNADGTGARRLPPPERVAARRVRGWLGQPSELPRRWDDDARLRPFRAEADARRRARRQRSMGLKDPRTSFTLALWNDLVPELKVVVCVTSLEVARSLNRRGMFSYTTALNLWRTYNRRILEASTAEQRIVTEYTATSHSRRRSCGGSSPSGHGGTRAHVRARGSSVPRRSQARPFELADLRDAHVAPDIVELYRWLCSQAASSGPTEPSGARRHAFGDAPRRRARCRGGSVAPACRPAERAVIPLAGPDGSRAGIEGGGGHAPRAAYADRVRRIKELVRAETPPGACIAVVSKGDDELLELGERRVCISRRSKAETSRGPSRVGLPAVAQLEVVRAKGADYFLVPADSPGGSTTTPSSADTSPRATARSRQRPTRACCSLEPSADARTAPDAEPASPAANTSSISIVGRPGRRAGHRGPSGVARRDPPAPVRRRDRARSSGRVDRSGARTVRATTRGRRDRAQPSRRELTEAATVGAREAGGETLVFVDVDLLLLPGWLGPLVGVLHERGDAGAVGGRLLLPDGSLEEAGGTVQRRIRPPVRLRGSRPGSRALRLCPPRGLLPGLLATPRELFLELDGFDGRFSSYLQRHRLLLRPACAWPAGLRPACEYGGASGDRRESSARPACGRWFRSKWSSLLERQQVRPRRGRPERAPRPHG